MASLKLWKFGFKGASRAQIAPFGRLIHLDNVFERELSVPKNVQSNQDIHEIHRSNVDPFSPVESVHAPIIDNINPPLKKSFNLASYVNHSNVLQELVKLGVSLYDIESLNPDAAKHLLLLDLRDCTKYLKFLVDNGVKSSNVGRFISEFPEIFQLPIVELQSRLEFFKNNGFSTLQISKGLNRSSHLIAHKIETIDYKLAEFQAQFDMPAFILRSTISKYPPILSHSVHQYKVIKFCLAEEFGFRTSEIHVILENQPKTIDFVRRELSRRLDLVHNTMKFSHSTIKKFPKLITGPDIEMRNRFLYLKKLKRDQFDPRLPLYVQPSALYNGTDEDFCKNHAKTTVDDYKLFVKTCL